MTSPASRSGHRRRIRLYQLQLMAKDVWTLSAGALQRGALIVWPLRTASL